jgi:hypothetical protein
MPFYIVRDLATGRLRVIRQDRPPAGSAVRSAGPYERASLARDALAHRDLAMLRQLFDGVEAVETPNTTG